MSALESQAAALFPFQGADHKAWAKRIMWRHDRGDKTLSMIQLQFARTALEIEATA